jgi:hypothetical protein
VNWNLLEINKEIMYPFGFGSYPIYERKNVSAFIIDDQIILSQLGHLHKFWKLKDNKSSKKTFQYTILTN